MLLYLHNSTCVCNHPYNLHQKSVPLLQPIFNSLVYSYFFKRSSLQSPVTLPSSTPKKFFTELFLRATVSTIYIKIFFCTSDTWPIQAASRDHGVVWGWHSIISLFFIIIWIMITGDSQSLIPYRSETVNWCITGLLPAMHQFGDPGIRNQWLRSSCYHCLWWRYLQLEAQVSHSIFSHTLKLLPLLP